MDSFTRSAKSVLSLGWRPKLCRHFYEAPSSFCVISNQVPGSVGFTSLPINHVLLPSTFPSFSFVVSYQVLPEMSGANILKTVSTIRKRTAFERNNSPDQMQISDQSMKFKIILTVKWLSFCLKNSSPPKFNLHNIFCFDRSTFRARQNIVKWLGHRRLAVIHRNRNMFKNMRLSTANSIFTLISCSL